MSTRTAILMLLKDVLHLLAGITLFCIVAWCIVHMPSEEHYISDSMPGDVGLGAVVFFFAIIPGFMYLVGWSVHMYLRRIKHTKTKYYWLNMVLSWLPYALMLVPYVYVYIRYQNRH